MTISQKSINSKLFWHEMEYEETLESLLLENLDFHDTDDHCATHHFHSFPAKFPPMLPRKFINELTRAGDIVLDPMAGSGTTILEAILGDRVGIGLDIDPLAQKIIKVKATSFDLKELQKVGTKLVEKASTALETETMLLKKNLEESFSFKSKQFIDYWFFPETQLVLFALAQEIKKINDVDIRTFSEIVFSSIIVTKSGGVSLALDLGHTRPHLAKVVWDSSGNLLRGDPKSRKADILKKILRSPLEEFQKRWKKNLEFIQKSETRMGECLVCTSDSQKMALKNDAVDLIVTSPPYASNAIDYMRAHKFTLVWLGYPIDILGEKRKDYIGGESITNVNFESLPEHTQQIVNKIRSVNEKKGMVLHRYYSEMTRSLQEMFRVLKPGKAAIVIVGNSIMRGINTDTAACLAEIGQTLGFKVPQIGVRYLERNKRMMPVSSNVNLQSQIQQRMHEEYVIGFYKPVINNNLQE